MVIEERECNTCGEVKPIDQFHKNKPSKGGHLFKCKSCVSEYDDRYRTQNAIYLKGLRTIKYKKNREQVLAACKEWRTRNKEKKSIADKNYRDRNKKRLNLTAKNYRDRNKKRLNLASNSRRALRMKNDPVFRVIINLRWRVSSVLRGGMKAAKTMQLIGCSKQDLMIHLQNQFRPGMSWNNYGSVWHVDHIRPCVSFNMTDPEQQKDCFHYTNLQPLFGLENILKSSKYQETQ